MNALQFSVLEHCDDFEQLLALRVDDGTPALGVLEMEARARLLRDATRLARRDGLI